MRHPLATIASGVRGFCDGGLANSTPNALVEKIRAVVPALPGRRQSCAAVFASFWAAYYQQAVEAADGWYRVETTPPCQVARAAGLVLSPGVQCQPVAEAITFASAGRNRTRTAHESAAVMAVRQARSPRGESAAGAAAAHGRSNRHNRDGFAISYEEIERLHGGVHLAAQLRALAVRFGYDNADVDGKPPPRSHPHHTSPRPRAGTAESRHDI